MLQDLVNSLDNITIKNLISFLNVCAPDWGETDCLYGYNKFYYFIEGECTLIIDGDEYHPEPGDLFMIPADTKHTYYHNPKRPVYKYWCHFDLSMRNGQKLVYSKTGVKCKVPGEKIVPVFKKLIDSYESRNPLDILEEKSALLELLWIFLSNVNYKSVLSVSPNDFVSRINDYITQNIQTSITLKQLAEVIHLHPNYFTQYFKKHFNKSPIEHVNYMRMERAAQLLIHNPEKSIRDVANESGFIDYRYFSRLFKKMYGITPSQYKGIHNRS